MRRRELLALALGEVPSHEGGGPLAVAGLDRVEDREVLAARLHQRARIGGEGGELLELAQPVDVLDRLQHEAIGREARDHLVLVGK